MHLPNNSFLVPAWVTIDVNGALQTGNAVNMAQYNRVTFYAICNDSTGVNTFTQYESTAAALTGKQELATIAEYWELTHATSYITDGEVYDYTARTTPLSTVATTTGNASVVCWTTTADQLSPGYDFYSVDLTAETGAACIIAAFYIMSEPRYRRTNLVSPTS